jgi:hypothetical protein
LANQRKKNDPKKHSYGLVLGHRPMKIKIAIQLSSAVTKRKIILILKEDIAANIDMLTMIILMSNFYTEY